MHLGLSSGFILSDFPTKTLYVFHISPMRTACLSLIFRISNKHSILNEDQNRQYSGKINI